MPRGELGVDISLFLNNYQRFRHGSSIDIGNGTKIHVLLISESEKSLMVSNDVSEIILTPQQVIELQVAIKSGKPTLDALQIAINVREKEILNLQEVYYDSSMDTRRI